MNKAAKIILWAVAVFVLIAVGILIIAFAQFLGNSNSYSNGMGDMMTATFGVSSEDAYTRSAGLGMNSAGAVDAVRTFAKASNMQLAAPEMMPQATMGKTVDVTARMIVKTGELSVVVKDVREAIKSVGQYAVSQGGFVVNSNVYKIGIIPRGTVVVRVPSNKFDNGMNEVKTLGEVTDEISNGQDITEEYVDLDAQLRNLRATEAQFLAIMVKAQKIEDILNVQRELTNVRGEIERLQGRMKYLKQNSDLSTITVNFSTDPVVLPTYNNTPEWKPWAEVKDAARTLLNFGKRLVNVAIWFVVFVPIWAVIAAVVWLVVRIGRRMMRK